MTWEGTDAQGGLDSAVLTVFGGGSAAETAGGWPAADRDACFAAPLGGLFPGFAEAFVESRFMDWPGNPDAGAGYAFPGPGEVTRVAPLLEGGHGAVEFAGEYTSPAFMGYMEGALSSGARVARKIAAPTR